MQGSPSLLPHSTVKMSIKPKLKFQVPTFTGIHVAVVINEMSGILSNFTPGLSLSVRRLIHSAGSVLNI